MSERKRSKREWEQGKLVEKASAFSVALGGLSIEVHGAILNSAEGVRVDVQMIFKPERTKQQKS